MSYPSIALFHRLETLSAYPADTVPVPSQIPGLAFFPGGHGVFKAPGCTELPPFPVGGAMVVGQDFDTLSNFRSSLAAGEEDRRGGTWGNLLTLLRRSQLDPTRCFFTNAYMGLRLKGRNTGWCNGSRDNQFRDQCMRFFAEQLATQQPRLLISIGLPAAEFLSRISPQLAAWRGATWRSIDSSLGGPLQVGVSFNCSPLRVAAAVALVHPSLRGPNLRHRRFGGHVGESAELALLQSAIDLSLHDIPAAA